MRKILRVTSILGVATIVKLFSGLARAKYLAWMLGPVGIGIVGQAQMFSAFTVQVSSLNFQMGITKDVSESLAKNDKKISLILNTARTMQFMAAILFIIAVLPFSGILTKFVFSDSKYLVYFAAITAVTPFTTFITGMADPVFYGYKKITECARLTILMTLIGLGFLLVLAYFYKVQGVLAQIALVSVVSFLISYYYVRKNISIAPSVDFRLLKDKASRLVLKDLVKYSLISFIPGNVNMLVLLYLRGMFMKQYGVEANGFYQVAYAISNYYLPFVTNGLWGHFYPEMCSLKKNRDINFSLNQFARFTLLAATAIAAGVIIFRKYMILALFSGKFMAAYDLLAIQAIGDIFFVFFCMFSTSLMARRKFKGVILISTLGYNFVLLASYLVFTRFFGLGIKGLNMAIAVTNLTLVAVHIVYARIDTSFWLNHPNTGLLLKSLAFIAAIFLIPDANLWGSFAKIALSAIWISISLTPDEIRKSFSYIKNRVNRGLYSRGGSS